MCCFHWCVVHLVCYDLFFFFSSRRRHTRLQGDWSSDVCSSDLATLYQAKRPTRSFGSEVSASTACSVGKKRVTSPLDGLMVPTKATTRSGQNAVTDRKSVV